MTGILLSIDDHEEKDDEIYDPGAKVGITGAAHWPG
jgi:hypothetical protein